MVAATLHSVSVSAGELAVIIGALAILSGAIRAIYRFVKRLDDMQSLVMKELRPNGGSSLRDAITRIDKSIDQRIDAHIDARIDQRIDERMKQLDHQANPE